MTQHQLSEKHRHMLEVDSAISPEIVEDTGYYTVTNPRSLPAIFAGHQRELHGLVIPNSNVFGEVVSYQIRPQNPRVDDKGRTIKYESAMAGMQCIDVPPRSRRHLRSKDEPLWFTEGRRKADSALSHGVSCILSLNGVYGWMSDGMALVDFAEIRLRDREVVLAFDSDVMSKYSVREALERFARYLTAQGAKVRYLAMDHLPDGGKCGLDDYFARGGQYLDLLAKIVDTLPGGAEDWERPAPLDPDHGPPLDPTILPDILGEFSIALAEATQTPVDMTAIFALGAVSAVTGGKYIVDIPEAGWEEQTNLYLTAAMDSANRKTAVVTGTTRPISDYEKGKAKEHELEHARWESRMRVLEKQLGQAESAEVNPDSKKLSSSGLQRDAAVAEIIRHRASEPRSIQFMMDDVTSEAAKALMSDQGGAGAVISAESQFLSIIAGRYSSGNADLDLWTKGHAGDFVTVNRIGRTKSKIDRAALTVVLAVQKHVLAGLGNIDGFMDVGGAARILPTIPAELLGSRKIDGITPVSQALKDEWARTLEYLMERAPRIEDGCYTPWRLYLAPDAYAEFTRFRRWHEPYMGQDSAYRDIRDWFGKLPGAVLRLAGTLHIVQWEQPENELISLDTINRAIRLAHYFTEHAKVMYSMMASAATQSLERVVLDTLIKQGQRITTKRELHKALDRRRAFQKSSSLNAPLNTLADLGWIRQERQGKSDIIFVSPFAFETNDEPRTPPNPQTYGDNGGNAPRNPFEVIYSDPMREEYVA
jgi:hypothetical protein